MGSLDGLCVNCNGYSQGIHTSVSMYLLWACKIHCFITTTNHIVRKFNLLLPIPYKGAYLWLLRRILISFITEVTGHYLT